MKPPRAHVSNFPQPVLREFPLKVQRVLLNHGGAKKGRDSVDRRGSSRAVGRKHRERRRGRERLREWGLERCARVCWTKADPQIRKRRTEYALEKSLPGRLRIVYSVPASQDRSTPLRQKLPGKSNPGCERVFSLGIVTGSATNSLDTGWYWAGKKRTQKITGKHPR